MAEQPLPDPARHITTNNDDGKSFISEDVQPSVPIMQDLDGTLLRLGYTTSHPVPDLTNNADLNHYKTCLGDLPPLVRSDGGLNIWYIDTPPNSESPMHRTVSLDFVVPVIGEIELTLESGEKRIVRPGDMTIQRSTLHKWRNPSKTEWSRMVGVTIECQPVLTKNAGTLDTDFQ